nr:nucleic acid-binding, OB-fold, replication protein A, OB domain protein [Tanacetum cinerariifolium]
MCFCISEFGVTDNDAKDTFVVKHPYKINFYRTTRLKKCDDFSGLVYGFNFKSFTDLLQERQDSTFAYEKPNVSNMFNATNLIINADIPEINSFKKTLLENLGGEALDHQIVPLVKYDKYDISQDFLVKLQKVNLADIRDIVEIKSVVVVATTKVIERDNKWYYLACGSCNRIVDERLWITKTVILQLLLPSNSEQSLSLFLSPPTMGKLKGAMSGPGESSSFGYAEDSNDTPPLKRSIEVIDVEDISDLSSNKKQLIVPKKENE